MITDLYSVFFEGFILQMSLIFGLGAQNIFVLESGIKKNHHLLMASICSLCDFILIMLGVSGFAQFVIQYPWLKFILGCFGVLFLFIYGVRKVRESFSQKGQGFFEFENLSKKKMIFLCLSFSLLNPHVYLDTIIFIGSFATKFPQLELRVLFGLGASFFSCFWFFLLSTLSAKMAFLLKEEKALKWTARLSGLVLIFLGVKLGLDIYSWMPSLS